MVNQYSIEKLLDGGLISLKTKVRINSKNLKELGLIKPISKEKISMLNLKNEGLIKKK